ncbi:hypothetical protein GOP47_0006515 [Adiantum capillus-veneris]|uniref:Amine oxidase domain-containing protein n=1 Tax=Adiantum capillus-veneris TaxID=13818 RepID=A0A9D4V3F4_ADICA|nr:hypothetical protein GOP47_0006515 [Adiantum capillus-veneris]
MAVRWSFQPILLCLLCIVPWLFSLSCPSRHIPSSAGHPSVIIIGAGMSGIMAAKTLSEHGIDDFLILDATDRIGGRMHQTTFAGYTIEMGANWVEGVGGEEENPIWTLAKKYNLRVSYSDFDNMSSNTYNEDGTLLPLSFTEPHFDLADASFNYTNELSNSLNAHGEEDISILTAQRIFGVVPSTPLDMVIDFVYYDFENAEPPRVTSLKNAQPTPTFVYYGDDEYFVADKRGYVHILHELAKGFLKHNNDSIMDSRLKLKKVVTNIISLGVLKSTLIKYTPDLPYWKIKTFYQFDMTIYTKVFLKFSQKFWPTGPGSEFFLYADGKRGYYPFWQHLENVYPGSNILFVTVTDDESRRIEQQPDHVTKTEIMEVLRKMFGERIPDASEILVPRWWKNSFHGGSYINWPIGVSEADFDRMKAPIGPLYFTGEHTSAQFNGYVHGAYLSGIATAETLIDCIKYGKCDEITSDELPGTSKILPRNGNLTSGNCTGSCCVDVQQERETLRQSYVGAIDALQAALAAKCRAS